MEASTILSSSSAALVATRRATLTLDAAGTNSCTYHRLTLPFGEMDVAPKVPVFVFNRRASCGVAGLLRLREKGVRLIADVDDYWVLDQTHYLFGHFQRDGITRDTIACLTLADLVMVTNEVLADEVRTLNRNIVIVPNALPFDSGQFVGNRGAQGRTFFVYAAGASHCDDMLTYRAAFESSHVTIAGWTKTHPEWSRVSKNFPRTPTANERPVSDYMRVYDGHSAALAPLVDSRFTRCKSNLKTLEAGCKGMPIIASRVHPYWNARDRDFVLYAENGAEMKAHMDRLERDPTFTRETGEALAEHVRRSYSLDAANEIRRQILMRFS